MAKQKQYKIIKISVILLVVLFIILFWVNNGGWITPDLFFLGALIVASLTGRLGQFVKYWAPLLLILFAYEYVRGLVPDMITRAHTLELIQWENQLFGFIPTIYLQKLLWHGFVRWFDIALVFIYTLHFVIPQIFAYFLWIKSKVRFQLFAGGLIWLSIAGVITYYIFPATPPWLASTWGYLSKVHIIQNEVYRSMNFQYFFSIPKEFSLYSQAGANPVAAFPSLHSAYPFLIALFAVYFYGRRGLPLLIYPALVWFFVIYSGDHYFIDVFAGVVYASMAFLGMIFIYKYYRQLLNIFNLKIRPQL